MMIKHQQALFVCLFRVLLHINLFGLLNTKSILYNKKKQTQFCFHWLFTKRQMSIRTAEVRPFFFFFFALVEAQA